MHFKKYLFLHFLFRTKLNIDIINDIFDRAFINFKPNTNDELKEAVELWILDEAKAFNIYGHMSFWNTSLITDMSYIFQDAENFNQPIGNWDVSNVTDMSEMFDGAKNFNQHIGGWDVSNVTNMSWMIEGAKKFNQTICNWKPSNCQLPTLDFQAPILPTNFFF